jgi:hypothetical protein
MPRQPYAPCKHVKHPVFMRVNPHRGEAEIEARDHPAQPGRRSTFVTALVVFGIAGRGDGGIDPARAGSS